jgi:hypothetical protein
MLRLAVLAVLMALGSGCLVADVVATGALLDGWTGTADARDQPMVDAADQRARRREIAQIRATGTRLELERPARLDGVSVAAGIERVRPMLTACSVGAPLPGPVEVAVMVAPDGTVTSTAASSANLAAGACVASAIQGATFRHTRHGGSFRYTLH